MRSSAFYQERLDHVSRSFAMCVPQLDSPFREHVSLAYLLLRVLDTIEDAPFPDHLLQQRQFDRLLRFVRTMPSRSELEPFVAAFPSEISAHEAALVEDTYALLEDAHALPPPVRSAMFRTVERMAKGMMAYTQRGSLVRLVDCEDVSRYCCFVAGVVGEMLTELWATSAGRPPPPIRLAYHFGLLLQKVNILKDQAEDEVAGRFLVPDRAELLASVRDDADGAVAYLQALPREARGYRVFCAWCMMMAATTIAQLDEAPRSHRAETARLLAHTADIVGDNAALARQFRELMPALPVIARRPPQRKPESFEWFRDTLAAPLSDSELRALGVGT